MYFPLKERRLLTDLTLEMSQSASVCGCELFDILAVVFDLKRIHASASREANTPKEHI